MVISLVCQTTGRGKWGNFIAQWLPTWLIIGVYNKLVKLEGQPNGSRFLLALNLIRDAAEGGEAIGSKFESTANRRTRCG
jgi:hypothetical protein